MRLDAVAKSGWRGEGSAPWSAADDALLTDALALGFTAPDIAVLMGRSAGAVRLRRDKLARLAQDAAEESRRAARVKLRNCLRCCDPFESEGPHNRLCDLCRAGVADVSPMHPEGLRAEIDNAKEAAGSGASAAAPPGPPLAGHPWRARVTAPPQTPDAGRRAPGGIRTQNRISGPKPRRPQVRNTALP
jgi:hypothetical protein